MVWSPQQCELGEGARWVDDRLVLVDILAGRLLQAPGDKPGALREIARLAVPLGAVAPVAGTPGTWVAAAGTGIAYLLPSGRLEWLDRPEDSNAVPTRMNDGAADPAGRFWAGSMAYDATPGAGSLYRAAPNGDVTRVLDGMTIPNGPAFSPDARTMYLADSARGHVDCYPVDPLTGTLGTPAPFLRLDLATGTPDGMTVDNDDHLWIAIWGRGEVRRYRPDGTLDLTVPLPARQPTSVCLGGPGGRRLFITTAAYRLTPASLADGALLAVDVPATASPAHPFTPRP
ncbi:SMP-30/gluconolactonase/LRE family protein [Streptomyces sp. NBC_00322]|nr:SMP-30/gluconolactonase/LRE family protein [Streptomyces sp. NBC_00322]